MKKRIVFLIILIIFIVGYIVLKPTTALDFDNVKEYSNDDKIVTITNTFGLGRTIAKVELLTPRINYVMPNGYRRVMIWNVESYDDNYKDALKELEIKNMYSNKFISKTFHYEYAIYHDVPDTTTSCEVMKEGWTECVEVPNGKTVSKIKEWKRFNGKDIPKGKLTIALVTYVHEGDYYDGIPTLFGERLDRWAVWTDSLNDQLVSYYKFNETAGNLLDVVDFKLNGTVGGTPAYEETGIVGDCWKVDSPDGNATIGFDQDLNFTGNFTVNMWVNITTSLGSATQTIFTRQIGGAEPQYRIETTSGNEIRWRAATIDCAGGINLPATLTDIFNISEWNMITLMVNATDTSGSAQGYLNGVLAVIGGQSSTCGDNANLTIGSRPDGINDVQGLVDELGIWNRSLSASEIEQLYNDGAGMTYVASVLSDIDVTLHSPVNAFNTTNLSHKFSSTGTTEGATTNLTNASLYVWVQKNNTLLDTNTTTGTLGGIVNSTNLSVSTLTGATTYLWNVFYCGTNETGTPCFFAGSNFTLDTKAFIVEDEHFVTNATEGDTKNFQINVSTFNEQQISTANLNYNGTLFTGTLTKITDGNFTILRQLTIPNVNATVDHQFHWEILLADDSLGNSSFHNQTVININVDNCTTNDFLLLNYTLKDEKTQDTIATGVSGNATIEVDLNVWNVGLTNRVGNFSFEFNATNPAQVCTSTDFNNTEYRLFSTARYGSQGRVTEFHNIQNATLSNNTFPQNINLFDLETDDSTSFKVTFKDSSFQLVEDALIDVTRQYLSEGTFKSVEIPKTDSNGETVVHLKTTDVVYTIIVSKNGEILATFSNVVALCDDATIGDCELKLNAVTTSDSFDDFTKVSGLDFTITFTKATKTISSTFTTLDGSSSLVTLNTTKFDRFQNETVCTDSLTSSSGTLTCVVPDSFGNVTVVSILFKDGEQIATRTFTLDVDFAEIFGPDRLLLVLILMITLPLMFISSKIGVVIGVMLGLVTAGGLMMFSTGELLGPASALIWFFIAGGIIIWKISNIRAD